MPVQPYGAFTCDTLWCHYSSQHLVWRPVCVQHQGQPRLTCLPCRDSGISVQNLSTYRTLQIYIYKNCIPAAVCPFTPQARPEQPEAFQVSCRTLACAQSCLAWAYSLFLTRSRRRSSNESKATHSGGLLGNEFLAIRANLALFVLEEAETDQCQGLSAADYGRC